VYQFTSEVETTTEMPAIIIILQLW
jgi:hypothetical protein